jgi:elongation factor 1 alpha-like protein
MSKLALLAQKRKEAALAGGPSSPAPTRGPSAESPKPLSKLAQKMAAAKLAREAGGPTSPEELDAAMGELAVHDEDEATKTYFRGIDKPRAAKSPFFSILTSTARSPPDDVSIDNIHLPPSRDPERLATRIRTAFADAESPDDVVLRARQGRAGTAGLTTGTKA